jgi:hypothetical protein
MLFIIVPVFNRFSNPETCDLAMCMKVRLAVRQRARAEPKNVMHYIFCFIGDYPDY